MHSVWQVKLLHLTSINGLKLTFILAEFYISEEADLDDLPEQSQDQVGCPGPQIMGINVDDSAADRWGRVQSQDQVLLWIPNKICQTIKKITLYLKTNHSKQHKIKVSICLKLFPFAQKDDYKTT